MKKIYVCFVICFVVIDYGFCESNKSKINEVLKDIGTSVEETLGSDVIEQFKSYKVPEKYKKEASETISSTERILKSNVEYYKNKIKEDNLKFLIPDKVHTNKNERDSKTVSDEPLFSEGEFIFVLISSSIPKKTITNYISCIDKINSRNVKVVLNGFVGGMKYIKPTQDFITEVVLKDSGCKDDKGRLTDKCDAFHTEIIIDPLIFRKFNIKEVPAIIYVKNLEVFNKDKSFGYPGNVNELFDSYIISGDISLDYAFSQFYQATKNKKFFELQQKIRKGFY